MSELTLTPFPRQPDRPIWLEAIPFGMLIDRAVFKGPELAWIDFQVQHVASQPELWVPALMSHLEAHRVMMLDLDKLVMGAVGGGFWGVRRNGYPRFRASS